jgi:hypothetical protein
MQDPGHFLVDVRLTINIYLWVCRCAVVREDVARSCRVVFDIRQLDLVSPVDAKEGLS